MLQTNLIYSLFRFRGLIQLTALAAAISLLITPAPLLHAQEEILPANTLPNLPGKDSRLPSPEELLPSEPSSNSYLWDLAELGIATTAFSARAFLRPQKKDFTNFEGPLSSKDLAELKRFITEHMPESMPDSFAGKLKTKLARWANSPVVIVRADSVMIEAQALIQNKAQFQAHPEIFGALETAPTRPSVFARKIPFFRLEPRGGLTPLYKPYMLDAARRGGETVVTGCLDKIAACNALVRTIETTTHGKIFSAKIAGGVGYFFLAIPIYTTLRDLYYFLLPIPQDNDTECLNPTSGCSPDWIARMKEKLRLPAGN